jgi:hypothetical protein
MLPPLDFFSGGLFLGELMCVFPPIMFSGNAVIWRRIADGFDRAKISGNPLMP